MILKSSNKNIAGVLVRGYFSYGKENGPWDSKITLLADITE